MSDFSYGDPIVLERDFHLVGPQEHLTFLDPIVIENYRTQFETAPETALRDIEQRTGRFFDILNSESWPVYYRPIAQRALSQIAAGMSMIQHSISQMHADNARVHFRMAAILQLCYASEEGVKSIDRALEITPTEGNAQLRLDMLALKIRLCAQDYSQRGASAPLKNAHDALDEFSALIGAQNYTGENAEVAAMWGVQVQRFIEDAVRHRTGYDYKVQTFPDFVPPWA